MAGTDISKAKQIHGVAEDVAATSPAIILVEPQLGENIGTTARAMLNCGLTDLRLVSPRDGWPNDRAIASSSGAHMVIDNAKLFETTEDAIADLHFVLATTARDRDMIQKIYTPDAATEEIHARSKNQGEKCGILFGPERTGLHNDDVSLADAVLNVPLNPAFSSLNLAQAVLLIGYSWYSKLDLEVEDTRKNTGRTTPATKDEINHMIHRLEDSLEDVNFFNNEERKPSIQRNIRNMFHHFELTQQEVNIFQGIISAFEGRKLPRK